MSGALVIFILVLSAWGFVLWRALRRPRTTPTDAFAELYGVELTNRSRALLEAMLERSRRFRYAGAVLVAIGYVTIERNTGFWSLLGAIAVGFAIGSLADETTRPRVSNTGSAGAALERRSIFSFVERWVVVGLVIAMTATLVLGVMLIGLGRAGLSIDDSARVPGQAISIVWIVGALALAFLCTALLWRLVLLPTGGDSNDVLAVRHALRMASVLTVVGAMFVIFGYLGVRLGGIASRGFASQSNLIRLTSFTASAISMFSIAAGLSLSLRALPRTVERRSSSTQSAASSASSTSAQ